MKLFVGLGNPGSKYDFHRHNVGYMAVDRIAADHGFSPWRAKFQGQIAEGRLGTTKVLLLKPETFMNLSGQSVGEAARFFKIAPADITVFHDELDLAPGRVRAKTGGGHAGHNGLRSLHAHIGEGYGRVRIGIGHPGRKEQVSGYVLSDFARADAGWLDDVLRGIGDGAADLAAGDQGRFMNAVARRLAPPRPPRAAPSGTSGAASTPPVAADRKSEADPAPDADPAPRPDATRATDPRSALQKLVDRFR